MAKKNTKFEYLLVKPDGKQGKKPMLCGVDKKGKAHYIKFLSPSDAQSFGYDPYWELLFGIPVKNEFLENKL